MVIEKIKQVDVSVIGEFNSITVKTYTLILEDGIEISRSNPLTKSILPLTKSVDIVDEIEVVSYVDTDISNEDQKVIDVASVVWTDAIKTAFENSLK